MTDDGVTENRVGSPLIRCLGETDAAPKFDRYEGITDASAAFALDGDCFVVFDDERKALRVYRFGEPGLVDKIRIKDWLGDVKGEEFDFEGAVKVGKTIFAITSHGRKDGGKDDTPARRLIGYPKPTRHRFFAFTLARQKRDVALDTFHGYRTDLVAAIHASKPYRRYDLDAASHFTSQTGHGLNIEGLAAWKENGVLIGLRAPTVEGGRALLIPLLNPKAFASGDKKARFGAPVTLDLGGRGIRDIVRRDNGSYLIVAGPAQNKGTFALYVWSGQSGADAGLLHEFDYDAALELKPEVVFAIPGTEDVYVLSDDGDFSKPRNGDAALRSLHFRGLRLSLKA
jgi:hypothetical protein